MFTVRRALSTFAGAKEVVIASVARTPIGSFGGSLASEPATSLAAHVIKAVLERAAVKPDQVEEVYMGNVISAGIGQAPARQATLYAGIPNTTPCTTVNKVCASGMKAVMMASQNIALGGADIMVAGGFESMSNVPYYLPGGRFGMRYGHGKVLDGVVHDGLWDVYNNQHMGMCGEVCAEKYGFSREDQDKYAIESYTRAARATEEGRFKDELVPYTVKTRKGDKVVGQDEGVTSMNLSKLPTLRPAFKGDGTVTAANASPLNDGAAAMVLMSADKARELGIKPLARIRGFGDAAHDPVMFTTAPSLAVPKALASAGVSASDVEYHEINEAFSVVSLVNMQLLGLDHSRVNVNGGAVALGHPIGCSGARIIGTLVNVLRQRDATLGCASICNGGGGASALVIERLN